MQEPISDLQQVSSGLTSKRDRKSKRPNGTVFLCLGKSLKSLVSICGKDRRYTSKVSFKHESGKKTVSNGTPPKLSSTCRAECSSWVVGQSATTLKGNPVSSVRNSNNNVLVSHHAILLHSMIRIMTASTTTSLLPQLAVCL